MKKILITVALTMLGTGAFAQTSEGTKVLSGGVNFDASSTDYEDVFNRKETYTRLGIAPRIGYFIKNRLEIGVGLNYNHYSSTSKDSSNTKTWIGKHNDYNISPYLTKYWPLSERLFITGRASVFGGYTSSKSESLTADQKTRSTETSFGATVVPGIMFFPRDKFGLGLSFGYLNYTHSTTKDRDTNHKNTSNSVNLNLRSSSLSFDFSYFINR